MGTQTDFNPAIFEEVAEHLHMDVRTLERESLRAFLERQRTALNAEKFRIAEKYDVKTVAEMEQLYRNKRLAEQGTWEDFFEFEHIETELATIERALEKL